MAEQFKDKVVLITGGANGIGRPGEPEEIAAAVLYRCSAPAKFITGQTLVLDGGMTAQ